MQQTFTLALPSAVTDAACITASKRGMTLPDGSGSAAIKIDNRSGFWLALFPAAGLPIPPYTIGYVADFGVPAPSVDALFMATGPAGQISTLAGDTVVVTLYDADEAPPANDGTPFVLGTTPDLTLSGSFLAHAGVSLVATLGAVAGKRYRLLTYSTALDVNGLVGVSIDSPSVWYLERNGGATIIAAITLDREHPSDAVSWSPGLDVPLGQDVTINAAPLWAAVPGVYSLTYQQI